MQHEGEPDRSRQLVYLVPVGGCLEVQDDLLCRVGGDHADPAGRRFHFLARAVLALDRELDVLRLGDRQFLFQGQGLAGRHLFIAEHGSQRGVRRRHVREVRGAAVLQFQGQLHRVPGRAALLVRRQRGGKLDLAVLDRRAVHLRGEGFPAGLVGDRGVAGQVLRAHHGRKGIFSRFSRGDRIDRSALGGDGGVFLDCHAGYVHRAYVGDLVGHADFLPLLGSLRHDGALDLELRIGAGVLDLLGEVLGLVDQRVLPVLVHLVAVNGVLDLEGDLARFQLLLGHGPLAGPVLARADGQRGRAELFDLLAAGIVQRHRAGHINVADVGHRDGHRDRLRRTELVGAQLHGNLHRVIRERCGSAQQYQRDPQHQGKQQAFSDHIVSEPVGSFLLPPPESRTDASI